MDSIASCPPSTAPGLRFGEPSRVSAIAPVANAVAALVPEEDPHPYWITPLEFVAINTATSCPPAVISGFISGSLFGNRGGKKPPSLSPSLLPSHISPNLSCPPTQMTL